MKASTLVILVLIVITLLLAPGIFFVVDETEQVLKIRFKNIVGDPITEPGLYMKLPLFDSVISLDKRWLAWDGDPNQIPTRDKKYLFVDTFARWRIADPLKFYGAVTNERRAQSRLDDVIDGQTRDVIASYDLISVVRMTNRKFEITEDLKEIADTDIPEIDKGRADLEKEILTRSAPITMEKYGIELVDVRLKRVNYIETVRRKVYDRMISERNRIAERYRSEGQGRSAEIRGEMERDLRRIRSEAYKTSQELRGKADGEATKIYAQAYNRDPEFYAFIKSLETLERTLKNDTQLLLTTDSDLLEYMKKPK